MFKSKEDKLLAAARSGDLKLIEYFLSRGAEIDTKDDEGDTPLRIAAMSNQTETVRLLLEKGANPNIQNEYGNTPLIKASAQGYFEIARLLLEHGANADIGNNSGKTPLAWSMDLGHRKIETLLRTHMSLPPREEEPKPPKKAEKPVIKDPSGDAEWHVTDTLEIARVAKKGKLGREITDIFNFRAQRLITVVRNFSSKQENVLDRNFSDIESHGWLKDAADRYEEMTGTRPDLPAAPKTRKPLKLEGAG